jgi:hypothetical protein
MEKNNNTYKMPSSLSCSHLLSANPSPLFQRQQPLHKTVNDQDDNNNQNLDKLLTLVGDKLSNKSLKLEELKRLSYKYCCPNDANTILISKRFKWHLIETKIS